MSDIFKRKNEHLHICINDNVETHDTLLSTIHPIHRSLPELTIDEIDTSTIFLKQHIHYPFFISCMTGGSRKAYTMNKRFAEAAQQFGIPVGLGSIRILLENNALLPDFQLKNIAPSVPLLANLGAAQLLSIHISELQDMLKELKADAIVLHLNPAQELCQENGERNFRGIQEAIHEYIHQSEVPVIIKETGMGIHPKEIQLLLGYGASYVDIAGAGGSNWARIELQRYASNTVQKNKVLQKSYFAAYDNWGHPTGLLLLASYGIERRIASGGIRNAHDILVSLLLGATMAGLALPIVRSASISQKALETFLSTISSQLKQLMLLIGAKKVKDIVSCPLWIEPSTQMQLHAYCKATGCSMPDAITSLSYKDEEHR